MKTELQEYDDLAVAKRFFASHELAAVRLLPDNATAGKTPDFRIEMEGLLFAYCEVKSPRDGWLDEQLRESSPGDIVGGLRPDPTFNRISNHIHKAIGQFDAVNPDRKVPNILVFVNHDRMSSHADLRETLTGSFRADDGSDSPTMKHVSEGRIKDEKLRVDMYLWFQGRTLKPKIYLSGTDKIHDDRLCEAFGIVDIGFAQ